MASKKSRKKSSAKKPVVKRPHRFIFFVDKWQPAEKRTVTALMRAAAALDPKRFGKLIRLKHDPTATDSLGRNVFQYALRRMFQEEDKVLVRYQRGKISENMMSKIMEKFAHRQTEIANLHTAASIAWKRKRARETSK